MSPTPADATTDYELCKLVKRNSSLTSSSALQVADHIASYYNSAKGYSVVSAEVLARETRQHRTTVIHNLAEIEASGEWVVERKRGVPNRYRPVMALLRDPSRKYKDDDSVAPKSPAAPTKQVDPAPKPEPQAGTAKETAEPVSIPAQPRDPSDPQTDLPLYADNGLSSGNYPMVAVPGELSTNAERAQRLLHRIKSSGKKVSVSEAKLVKTYDSLADEGYPDEAIDILLWHQLENMKGINHKFLSLVLSKCVSNGEITEPKPGSGEYNPAVEAAAMVYNIKQARNRSGKPKFVERL